MKLLEYEEKFNRATSGYSPFTVGMIKQAIAFIVVLPFVVVYFLILNFISPSFPGMSKDLTIGLFLLCWVTARYFVFSFFLTTHTKSVFIRGLEAIVDFFKGDPEPPPPPKPQEDMATGAEPLEPRTTQSPLPNFVTPLKRFEHMWVCAAPGSGKSTLLSHFIRHDLFDVAAGRCSVIVMESNRDLIQSIQGVDRFAPGGDLDGRLVVIDVEDVEYPVALNLFDMGLSDLDASPRDKEALYNATTQLLMYVFDALFSTAMTGKQTTLFSFVISLLLEIPGATLDTMIELMQKGGTAKYATHLARCDRDTQSFFASKFNEPGQMEKTKSEVIDRLYAVKRNRVLSRMFSSKRTKLDLFTEMGKGKVILINASKEMLGDEGAEIFGRFFIALVLLAAQKRAIVPKAERLPAYFYVDEAQDFIAHDTKFPTILDQARKYNVGCIISHQRLEQMDVAVASALYSSTAIKFAAGLSDANASAMARNMNVQPYALTNTQPFTMVAYVRGVTNVGMIYQITKFDFNDEPRMNEFEMEHVGEVMREKYAFRYSANSDTDSRPDEEPGEKSDPRKPVSW